MITILCLCMFEMFSNKSSLNKNNPHIPKFWKEFVPHQRSHLLSAEIRAQVSSGTLLQCCVIISVYG